MSVEDILEEAAWRDRNGLDDLAWNPDAVAPPVTRFGDVYEREAKAGNELKAWGLVAICAALVTLAIWSGL